MDGKQLWSAVLAELELSLSSANFKTWFLGTEVVSQKDGVVEIGCQNSFTKEWLEHRYYSQIKSIIDKLIKSNNSLVFSISLNAKKPSIKKDDEGGEDLFSFIDAPKNNFLDLLLNAHLRTDFTFDTFAVSTSNEIAYAAARAISKSPGKAYNPLFLYGGVGVGKTHLMQAVGNEVLRINPKARIIYCMGEEFTNEIIGAIQSKDTKRFKEKYRGVDVLLMDDVQFIAGKMAVQEEFFHTFNAIQRDGRQIVLTSDRSPQEISKLEERILSRFEAGMIIDIQPPDFELRTAILLIKAKSRNANLSIEMAKLIAERVDSTRKIEGFLTRLLAESQLRNIPITEEFIIKLLGSSTEIQRQKNVASYRDFVMAVTEYYKIKPAEIKGERRNRQFSLPRQLLMYLLRTELDLPLMEIGEILGGRDHTTIIHGVDKISEVLPNSPQLQDGLLWIKKRVYG